MQENAVDAYNSALGKIDKLFDQKDWRADGFVDEVDKLKKQLETIDPYSVTTKDGFDSIMKDIQAISAKA